MFRSRSWHTSTTILTHTHTQMTHSFITTVMCPITPAESNWLAELMIHTHTYTHTHTRTHTYMRTHTHTHTRTHTYMRTHTHTHTHTHTCTHARTHAHIMVWWLLGYSVWLLRMVLYLDKSAKYFLNVEYVSWFSHCAFRVSCYSFFSIYAVIFKQIHAIIVFS